MRVRLPPLPPICHNSLKKSNRNSERCEFKSHLWLPISHNLPIKRDLRALKLAKRRLCYNLFLGGFKSSIFMGLFLVSTGAVDY